MLIIKELRNKEKMTQQQLADKLGVSVHSVRDYENKLEIVPSDILLKLSDIFHVTLDYLVGKQEKEFITYFNQLSPEGQKIMNDLLRFIN